MTSAPPWLERARQIAAKAAVPRRFEMKREARRAELYLYDEIGKDPWTGEGTTAKDVVAALAEASGVDELDVHVNSPGGQVFEGMAIYNAIRTFNAKKTVYVDGIAASIASVIALAGDRVITAEGSMWMLHEPSSGMMVYGNAEIIEDEARKTAGALRKVRESILDTYATNTGQNLSDLSQWMAAETWMTAAEAKARGFTDEIAKTADPVAKETAKASAAAPSPGAPRPSPGAEAALARARVRNLHERFPVASVGDKAGQPATTTKTNGKGTP